MPSKGKQRRVAVKKLALVDRDVMARLMKTARDCSVLQRAKTEKKGKKRKKKKTVEREGHRQRHPTWPGGALVDPGMERARELGERLDGLLLLPPGQGSTSARAAGGREATRQLLGETQRDLVETRRQWFRPQSPVESEEEEEEEVLPQKPSPAPSTPTSRWDPFQSWQSLGGRRRRSRRKSSIMA